MCEGGVRVHAGIPVEIHPCVGERRQRPLGQTQLFERLVSHHQNIGVANIDDTPTQIGTGPLSDIRQMHARRLVTNEQLDQPQLKPALESPNRHGSQHSDAPQRFSCKGRLSSLLYGQQSRICHRERRAMDRHYIHFETPDLATLANDTAPPAGPEEVLIKVDHAGINRADLLQRLGLYPPPEDASPIPGLEVAGQVVAVGERCTALKLGDRVCALTHGGGYASHAIAREDHCLALPDSLSTEQGAALPEALLTVWYNVMERGQLSAGETVLIYGGSSGIGSIGIQMAAALGANVISTAGSVARCDAVKALGASFVANHREGSLTEQITEAGYGGKVDVILDIAGGDLMQANLDLAALDGRIVCIGVMRGMQSEINLATLFMKRLTLTGSTLRRLDTAERARCFTAIRDRIWPQVIAGNIQPIVDTAYPLADVLEAHEHMRLGTHLGKLVLDCRMG